MSELQARNLTRFMEFVHTSRSIFVIFYFDFNWSVRDEVVAEHGTRRGEDKAWSFLCIVTRDFCDS